MNKRRVGKLLLLFALVNLAFLGWGLAHRRQNGDLRVTFLDVGQGDCAIIESPSGKALVVDTGGLLPNGDDQGRRVVAPFLRYRGIGKIDALLLTHADADHTGGAASLIQRFPVGLLLDNGEPTASQVVTRLLTAAKEHDIPYQAAHRGQELDFGDGVTARVLSPDSSTAPDANNNASIILRIQYGRIALLMTGDAEAEEEQELLRSGQALAGDVLKVAHHGSRTSTTPEFLAAVHPRFAVISVGAHNVYGHPSPEVVERLSQSGARVFRTDKNGAVTCTSDGVTVHFQTMPR